jgi:putative PIN family toxin of toxin-antitoxin system
VRIVLDTNVFVSGVFFRGPPRKILEAWRRAELTVVYSTSILHEYERVSMDLREHHPGTELTRFLRLVISHGELSTPMDLPDQITVDPDDEKFLACAVAAQVSVIVSGDRHLLDVSGWREIAVIRPADFAAQYLEGR